MENSPVSLSLGDQQFRQISIILSDLSAQLPARYVLLMGPAGQVIAEWGQRRASNPFTLAALIVDEAMLKAELSRTKGESECDRIVVVDGLDERLFVAQAGPNFAVIVIASHQIAVDWARFLIPHAVNRLRSVEVKPQESGPDPCSDVDRFS